MEIKAINFHSLKDLFKSKKKNLNLKLINNGISLRDFIHLDDVSTIYKKFLNNEYSPGIYHIGTGEGKLIKSLVNFVNIDKKKIIKISQVNEITKSIADVKKLKENLGDY